MQSSDLLFLFESSLLSINASIVSEASKRQDSFDEVRGKFLKSTDGSNIAFLKCSTDFVKKDLHQFAAFPSFLCQETAGKTFRSTREKQKLRRCLTYHKEVKGIFKVFCPNKAYLFKTLILFIFKTQILVKY